MNEVMEDDKKAKIKKYVIGLIICTLITLALTGLSIGIQILAGRNYLNECLLIWTNALTIAGVLMMSVYGLVKLSEGGAFDLLTYSIKLVWYNTFRKDVRKTRLAPTYYDYRVERNKKKKDGPTSYIFFPGLVFLIIGLILLIPFYS